MSVSPPPNQDQGTMAILPFQPHLLHQTKNLTKKCRSLAGVGEKPGNQCQSESGDLLSGVFSYSPGNRLLGPHIKPDQMASHVGIKKSPIFGELLPH